MARAKEDKYSKLRDYILGLVSVGVLLSGTFALAGAVMKVEFLIAKWFLGALGASFLVCYVLWWLGLPRSGPQKIAWAAVTLLSGILIVGGGFLWINAREAVFVKDQEDKAKEKEEKRVAEENEKLLKNPAEL